MENNVNGKQNRKVMIFACILSVISIVLLTLGFFLVSSDKVVLLQSISNLFNKYSDISADNSVLIDKITSSKNAGLTTDIMVNIADLKASLKLDYLENKDQKKTNIDLYLDVEDEEMFDANIVLSDDKTHLFIENLTPNYYHTDFEYITMLPELKSSDYEQITTLLKDTIIDYIDNEDITKEKVTISYNGKDKKVNKLTYEITNKTIKDIVSQFFDSIKKDKTLLEKIATYFDMTTTEIETSMNEILSSLSYEEEILYNYCVYYYGFNKIVGYEVEEVKTETVIEYKIQDTESINIYSGEEQELNIDITLKNKEYAFEGFIKTDEEKLTFTGTIIGNVITINVEDMKCIVTYNSNENDFYYEYNITLYSVVDDVETEEANIKIIAKYYFDEEIDVILDNSKDVEDITEDELNTIYNNLMNHPLYTLIAGYFMDSELEIQ